MKYIISAEEVYPVYRLSRCTKGNDCGIEVPNEKVKWITRVMKDFDKVQDYSEGRKDNDGK